MFEFSNSVGGTMSAMLSSSILVKFPLGLNTLEIWFHVKISHIAISVLMLVCVCFVILKFLTFWHPIMCFVLLFAVLSPLLFLCYVASCFHAVCWLLPYEKCHWGICWCANCYLGMLSIVPLFSHIISELWSIVKEILLWWFVVDMKIWKICMFLGVMLIIFKFSNFKFCTFCTFFFYEMFDSLNLEG